jgi:hypothetical protein
MEWKNIVRLSRSGYNCDFLPVVCYLENRKWKIKRGYFYTALARIRTPYYYCIEGVSGGGGNVFARPNIVIEFGRGNIALAQRLQRDGKDTKSTLYLCI